MNNELPFQLIVENPTVGVDYGLQEGKGSNYKTVQTKRGDGSNMVFNFSVKYKLAADAPVFLGPYVHGTSEDRFIYIDIGTMAGQKDSPWTRRIKVPLAGISVEMIRKVLNDKELLIGTTLPGTGKDGGPSCATVRPVGGWKVRTNDI